MPKWWVVVAAAARELWLAAAVAVVAALVAVATLTGGWSDRGEMSGTTWPLVGLWPAALWGAVVVAGGEGRSLVHLLSRPVSRMGLLGARMLALGGALSVAAVVIGLGSAWLAGSAGPSMVMITLGVVVAMLCGGLAGAMLDREATAVGVATVLGTAMLAGPMMALSVHGVDVARLTRATGSAGWLFVAVLAAAATGMLGWVWSIVPRRGGPLGGRVAMSAVVAAGLLTTAAATAGSAASAAEFGTPAVVMAGGPEGLVLLTGTGEPDDDDHRVDGVVRTRAGAHEGWAAFSGTGRIADADARAGVVAAIVSGDDGDRLAVIRHGRTVGEVSLGTLTSKVAGRLAPDGRAHAQIVEHDGEPGQLWWIETDDSAAVTARVSLGRGRHAVVGWSPDAVWIASRPVKSQAVQILRRMGADGSLVDAQTIRTSTDAVLDPSGNAVAWLEEADDAVVLRVMRTDSHDVPVTSATYDDMHGAHVVGWLDPDHVVVEHRARQRGLRVLHRDGTEVARVRTHAGLRVTDVAGPPEGPWLLARGGGRIQPKRNPNGGPPRALWQRDVAGFGPRANRHARFAIVDGRVWGVDRQGRLWNEPVPWAEASR